MIATEETPPLNPISARQLRAGALLTEAIKPRRGLAAEFPDNADYKTASPPFSTEKPKLRPEERCRPTN
jgi:hypothetical protein